MKKIFLLSFVLLASFFSLLSLTACSSDDESEVKYFFAHTGCKSAGTSVSGNSRAEVSAIETTGSFEFQVENNVLIVNHKNAYFCCEQNEIAGEVRFEGNTIFLSESEKNPIANFICPYDLTFAIEGLQEGKYHVIVVKDGLERKDFHIELRSSEGTVVVNGIKE
jgi:hypothetical protein